MPQTSENIKLIEGAMALGFSVSEAVQRALGCSLSEFGRRQPGHFRPNEISMALTGYQGRVYPEIRDAICEQLEIPREYLDRIIAAQDKAGDAPATRTA